VLGPARFELIQSFLGMAIAAHPEELFSIMVRLADERILRYDAATVTLLDPIALRRLACHLSRVKLLTGLPRQLADESIQKFEQFLSPRQHS
jgi:hypothetical protein